MTIVRGMSRELARERHGLCMVARRECDHAPACAAASSFDNALYAPRNLNAPMRCRFSHLK
jgi:hypothetical protein